MTAFLAAGVASAIELVSAEPGSWGMLALGFIIVTSSIRRRTTAYISFA